jgi:hypothetical protein
LSNSIKEEEVAHFLLIPIFSNAETTAVFESDILPIRFSPLARSVVTRQMNY